MEEIGTAKRVTVQVGGCRGSRGAEGACGGNGCSLALYGFFLVWSSMTRVAARGKQGRSADPNDCVTSHTDPRKKRSEAEKKGRKWEKGAGVGGQLRGIAPSRSE